MFEEESGRHPAEAGCDEQLCNRRDELAAGTSFFEFGSQTPGFAAPPTDPEPVCEQTHVEWCARQQHEVLEVRYPLRSASGATERPPESP